MTKLLNDILKQPHGLIGSLHCLLGRERARLDRAASVLNQAKHIYFTGLGMLAYYAALARGQASIVGPFTALFPLLTLALAFAFLRERINRVQAAGMIFALAAVDVPLAAQPAAFRSTDETPCFTRLPQFPDGLETIQASREEFSDFGRVAKAEGVGYVGGCCGRNAA
jgi:EamA-like transporter family